eukprot:2226751-Amphidinium_carterae.1
MYAADATNIIASHDPERGPFFMYMSFHNTHDPYQAPEKYLDTRVDFGPRRMMQGMLTCVSEATGNMTLALKANKYMWNNTLLIWAADNGGPQYWNANNEVFEEWPLLQVGGCLHQCEAESSKVPFTSLTSLKHQIPKADGVDIS